MGQERGCKFARRWWNCFLDLSQGSLCNWFFQVRAFLSLGLSHCSKDMKQWTSVTARLQLKLLLSRQQIIHTPVRGEGRRTLKKWSQPVSAPPVDTFLSPSPRAWLVLPYAKWGLHRPSVRKVVFFFPTGGSHPSPWWIHWTAEHGRKSKFGECLLMDFWVWGACASFKSRGQLTGTPVSASPPPPVCL